MRWTESKRNYRETGIAPSQGGFAVTLDGRAARTPAGAPLAVPTERLAQAIADEWSAQVDKVRPHTMPVTQLAATAIDRVAENRQSVIKAVVQYAGTDLLCYRAEESDALAGRQRDHWQPLLDWIGEAHGARLRVTAGVLPIDQPPSAVGAIRRAVEALGDLELAALASATAASGSLVIALALAAGRVDAEEAYQASQLEETGQSERWGEDVEATEQRQRLRADIEAAAKVMALSREAEEGGGGA